jgi:glutamate synthase domain-containing protein 3
MEMVMLDVPDNEDTALIKNLIMNHLTHTGSEMAAKLLKNWDQMIPQVVKVMPLDYKAVLDARKSEKELNKLTQENG